MDDQPAEFFRLWLFTDSKKHDKRIAKKTTFVKLTCQKKFALAKNDTGMGTLRKASKRSGNFFRMKPHELTFHYKSHFFLISFF